VEAFEQFVAVALGAEKYVVGPSTKFLVARRTKKRAYAEVQEHGYEVDLVGARAGSLVLASVKSFFGSAGVKADDVAGTGKGASKYLLLNDREVREGVLAGAASRFGYSLKQIRLRLYVGQFAGKDGLNERRVREWVATQVAGGGPIEIVTLRDVIERVRTVAASTTYVDNPVVVAMKVLAAANLLDLARPLGDVSGAMLADVEDEADE
jgi:hypothetical protein